VWANIIAPTLVPGVAPFFGVLAIPATMLAALCESPFIRRAGVSQQPLFHAMAANTISTAAGFVLLPIAVPAAYAMGPIWVVLAVALSTWIEGSYFEKLRIVSAGGVRWSWIIWGNVVSCVLLVAVSVVAHAVETPSRAFAVSSIWWQLVLGTSTAGVVGFLVGLHRARRSAAHARADIGASVARGSTNSEPAIGSCVAASATRSIVARERQAPK
jgi:hypothetical protein